MTRIVFTAATLLLAATAAQAKLEIQGIQAVQTPLGPERKTLDAYPTDDVIFRFMITGVQVEADGRVDTVVAIKMTNTDGDLLLSQEVPLRAVLSLGGNTFPAQTRITMGDKLPPGVYTVTVTVTDKSSGEKASFQRKVTLKPSAFVLIGPEFAYDAEWKIPAPPSGLVGQVLHFRLRAIGLDKSQSKIDSTMTVEILDAQGKEVLPKPISVDVKFDDPDVVKQAASVTYRTQVLLNRPGDFTLRVSITDRVALKIARYETPIRVTAP